jgi:hypothetical protein
MRKILHFTSSRQRYDCDAALVWCFDNRFESVLRKLLKRLAIYRPDPIRFAGGAKCLVSPQYEGDRQFVLDQIRKSMQLHGTRTILLMLHSDCGAYGGLAAFNNDPAKELENHRRDLHAAAAFVKEAIPELTVRGFFVDFDGIWEMEDAAADASQRVSPSDRLKYV